MNQDRSPPCISEQSAKNRRFPGLPERVHDRSTSIRASGAFDEELSAPGDRWRVLSVVEELKGKARTGRSLEICSASRRVRAEPDSRTWNTRQLCGDHADAHVTAPGGVQLLGARNTGNMWRFSAERYGTEEHKERWLKPLLAGEIRSAFA